jgi:peptide/nickel transport system substrate-binding protein
MMKKLRWQILIIFLTLVVVGVLIIRQQPAPIIILPQPSSGGIYTEAIVGSFGRLNPLFDINNPADKDIDRLIFSGLFRFDSNGLPQPDLAESWGVSVDGTIYNVSIRPNAVWHDGEPVTSDDVVFTLGLMRSLISTIPADILSMWDQVEITVLDNNTLRFELAEPFSPFLDYLAIGILPKHILESIPADQLLSADFNLQPVGCGPYQFDSLTMDNGQITGVNLKVFPDYYGQQPYIEKVSFVFYANATAALNSYQRGEVLGISQIPLDILDAALAEPNLSIYSSRLPKISLMLFNLQNSDVIFLQDKDIRRALMLGLNRQRMINTLLKGQAIIADSPILPGNWAYYNNIQKIDFYPDEAVSILKNSGYILTSDGNGVRVKDDIALSFTLLHPDDELHTSLAKMIQSDWAKIGVQVQLQPVVYDQLISDYLEPRNYQAALVDLDFSNTHDPDPYPFWHQSEAIGGQNYSQWDNRTASEYIEQARVITDSALRAKLYRNFQILFAKELPALPLYYPVFTFGVDAQVSGIQIAPIYEISDRLNSFNNWYLITRRSVENVQTETRQP